MGNDRVMKAAGAGIREKLQRYEEQLNIQAGGLSPEEERAVPEVFQKLSGLEEQLNRLVLVKNELEELKNQLRHLEKRRRAYSFGMEDKKIKRNVNSSESAKRKLDLMADLSVRLETGRTLGLLNGLSLLIQYRELPKTFEAYGIYQILFLEEKYLRLRIGELEEELRGQNMKQLKEQIRKLYLEEYIPLSKKLLVSSMSQKSGTGQFEALHKAINAAEQENGAEGIMKAVKDGLSALYPVVLTTVDSVLNNFYTAIKEGASIDCYESGFQYADGTLSL